MPNVSVDALDFKLFFNPTGELPPGYSKPDLGTWTVSGAPALQVTLTLKGSNG